MLDISAALRPHPEVLTLPTYEVTLAGVFLGAGFTKKYAVICRNCHIGFLGLDLPLEEVPDERCIRWGKSWKSFTAYPLKPDRLFSGRKVKVTATKRKECKWLRMEIVPLAGLAARPMRQRRPRILLANLRRGSTRRAFRKSVSRSATIRWTAAANR